MIFMFEHSAMGLLHYSNCKPQFSKFDVWTGSLPLQKKKKNFHLEIENNF